MSQSRRTVTTNAEPSPAKPYPVIRERLELTDWIADLRSAANRSEHSGGQHSATLVTRSGSVTVEIHLPAKASRHLEFPPT